MTTKTRAAEPAAAVAPADKILCGVDFSRQSLGALQAARALASRWGARLELLCATDVPAYLGQNEDTDDERRRISDFRRSLKTRLRAFAGEDAACLVWDGPPDRAVVEAARERRAGLIVLGTHGRVGLPRLVLGSTAEAVIAETGVPVLVVPTWSGGGWPRRILAPVKFTDYADRALLYADAFARSVGAELGVLHVVEPGAAKESIEALREHVARLAPAAGFSARETRYDVSEAILREAEAGGCDLIVMAAHRKPFWRDWTLGMTVQRLLRYSAVPVLSLGASE